MYVADVTDPDELRFLEREAMREWNIHPCEQNGWDLEDIRNRMKELGIRSNPLASESGS